MINFFHLQERKSTIKQEFFAGLTTFMTMSYIIVVNPRLMEAAGMDFGAAMTATILATAFACFYMALVANYPFALAPAMGINAYFTYGVVVGGGYSWEEALGAVVLSSIGLIILNLLGIRQAINEKIPHSLRIGTTTGIGLLLIFIGLKEVGVIAPHSATFVTLGTLSSPPAFIACLGVIALITLLHYNVWGAPLWIILMLWIVGLVTGLAEWRGFFDITPSIEPLLFKLRFPSTFDSNYYAIVLTFIFVCMFDAAGAIIALARMGGFLDSEGKLPHIRKTLSADAIGSLVGAFLGAPPQAFYLESAAGIAAGGRTGLTCLFVSLFFLACLFFTPIAMSIPMFATAPVLIVIGLLMAKEIMQLQGEEYDEFIPGFLIFITIPLTFSISGGIGLGFIAHALLKLFHGKGREVHWLLWCVAAAFVLHFSLVKSW